MKRRVYMLLSALILVGCSVTNRIMVTNHEEEGLKNIRLVQSPEFRVEGAENGKAASSYKDVSTVYLFEEKPGARPQMTLETDLFTQVQARNSDISIMMVLDNEDIPLAFYASETDSLQPGDDSSANGKFKQRYLIPENLWLSIVHAKELSYHIPLGEKASVQVLLNQKEKEILSEFIKMAIRQRDLRFPAVPEGQVKW